MQIVVTQLYARINLSHISVPRILVYRNSSASASVVAIRDLTLSVYGSTIVCYFRQ